jgi:signal peptidase II
VTPHRWLYLVIILLTVILDQVVKAWARGAMRIGEAIAVPWPGVFELKLVYNEGVAFGLLAGKGALMTPFAVLIAVLVTGYLVKHPQESRLNHAAYGLLVAGALGNLIDRLKDQRVTDMFWFRLINFPVFNIADAAITVGAILLMFGWLKEDKKKAVTE